MLLELMLLMIALISGSVVMPALGAKPRSKTASATTSSKLPLISVRFIEVSFAMRFWVGGRDRGSAHADAGIAGNAATACWLYRFRFRATEEK